MYLSQDLNATLEGDIDELRQIHNEGLTTKRPPGLPPAYGSLDEEDLPPYDIHKDSGALNVATLKHLTRARFDQTLRAFGSTGPTYQMSIETANMPGLRTFCKASLALFEAVACLQKAGDGELNRFGVDVHSGTTDGVQRLTAAKSFMAARVANLVLELGWRTLALNEVRPQSCVFTPRALSFLKNMYSGVDDVLLETIRQWNAESKTNWGIFVEKEEARAEEFQVYLTQLVALRSRFRLLVTQTRPSSPRWSGEFFCKSILFLQEAVEKERMQQANILRSQSKELERAEREVSVISSDGIPMKVESEEDDAW